MKRALVWLALGTIAAMALAKLKATRTPEPSYKVIRKVGSLEVRRYGPQIRATTTVPTHSKEGDNRAFRQLAHFIFGGNAERRKLPMTAPVEIRPELRHASVPPGSSLAERQMAFVMPEGLERSQLPDPDNGRITFETVGPRTVAALRFSGGTKPKAVARREEQLLSAMRKAGLMPATEPVLARYDPPWIPPFLRRNEILIDLAS